MSCKLLVLLAGSCAGLGVAQPEHKPQYPVQAHKNTSFLRVPQNPGPTASQLLSNERRYGPGGINGPSNIDFLSSRDPYSKEETTSSCSQYSGQQEMCNLCTAQSGGIGDCFWCSEDNSCHDAGSVLYPATCENSGCVSHNIGTSCTGSCAPGKVSGFDVPLAQCMLGLCNASYYNDKTLQVSLEELGVSASLYRVMDDASVDTQGLVIIHPEANAVTIAYRGTELNLQNGKLDLDCTLENYQTKVQGTDPSATQGWEVANGFADAFNSLKSQLESNLEWALGKLGGKPKLYITGHSLGGAMATIAASAILTSSMTTLYGSMEVITFAAPRSGNPTYAEGIGAMQQNWWSVQNFFDQIPHLPTASMGFQHVQRIVIVGPNDGNIVEVTPSQDDEHFDLTKNPIDFHHVSSYMDLLNSLTGAATGPTSCPPSVLS